MIHASDRQKAIIFSILSQVPVRFYAFGSRVTGENKPYSDLDLCFKEDLPAIIRGRLYGDFEESNLPFTVDVVDWKKMTPSFKKLIEKDLVPLPKYSVLATEAQEGTFCATITLEGNQIGEFSVRRLNRRHALIEKILVFDELNAKPYERSMVTFMAERWAIKNDLQVIHVCCPNKKEAIFYRELGYLTMKLLGASCDEKEFVVLGKFLS